MNNKKKDENEKIAAAIEYDKNQGVPKVVAKGKGYIAEKIIEKAKDENVTLYEDKELANFLNNLNIGDNVPEALYDVVAQILVFVSNIDKKVKDKLKME